MNLVYWLPRSMLNIIVGELAINIGQVRKIISAGHIEFEIDNFLLFLKPICFEKKPLAVVQAY